MKAVLDTNFLISGLRWKGPPFKCLAAAENRVYQLLTSEEILAELENVLVRKFPFDQNEISIMVQHIRDISQRVVITTRLRVIAEDATDDKVIETAINGDADYIVSGDRHLIKLSTYHDIKIISPAEFLKLMAGSSPLPLDSIGSE